MAGGAAQVDASGAVPARDRAYWPALAELLDDIAAHRSRPVTVLDCGGGSGSLAVPLAIAGAHVTVLDSSVDALATLARRADEAGVATRVTGIQGDVEEVVAIVATLGDDLPEAEDGARIQPGVDLIVAHGVLDVVADPLAAITALASAVRPGGGLSLSVANPVAAVLSRALAGDPAAALALLAPPGARTLDADTLVLACRGAGLDVVALRGVSVVSDLVPGNVLEAKVGAAAALAAFEAAVADRAPYRDIASRIHLLARRATER